MVLKRIQKAMQWLGWAVFILLAVNGLFSAIGGKSFLDVSVGLAQPDEQAMVDNPQASVPLYLDYEGYLTDMDGAPLTGYYTVTLRIYAGVANPIGDELWAEVYPNVPVRDGRFSVLLGNNTTLPENIFDFSDRFIGATVAPFDELVPRQRLASVPYAVRADHAASLNAPDGSPMDAVFVDNEGKVGIGMQTPQDLLHINQGSSSTGIRWERTGFDTMLIGLLGNGFEIKNIFDNRTDLIILENGNIGIGISSPTQKLQVSGNIYATGNLISGGNLNFTGQKACSVSSSGNWRQTLLVPSGWTSSTCASFKNMGGEGDYQLVCIFENSYSYGTSNGGIPNPNCGW